MKAIISYIQSPEIVDYKKPKIKNLGFLFLAYYLICFVSLPIIALIASELQIKHIETSNLSYSFIFTGVFLAPVYEEIIFRLCLVFTKRNYFITLAFIFALVSYLLFKQKYNHAIVFGVFFILFAILAFFDFEKIRYLINKHFKYLFWLSVISFGLVHITNFKGDYFAIVLLFPLLCFPQLVMGIILGYIRMQYGFIYSVFIHLLVNSILLLKLV